MSDARPYAVLGKKIDAIARSRDVRGAKAISEHIRKNTGEGSGRSAWSQILLGDIRPTAKNMALFRAAFRLTDEEEVSLAMEYTFRGPIAA